MLALRAIFLPAAVLLTAASPLAAQVGPITSGPSTQPSAELPPISDEDLVLLAKTVRMALHDKLVGKPERPARYHPPALKNVIPVSA